jgi:hypothetical protein
MHVKVLKTTYGEQKGKKYISWGTDFKKRTSGQSICALSEPTKISRLPHKAKAPLFLNNSWCIEKTHEISTCIKYKKLAVYQEVEMQSHGQYFVAVQHMYAIAGCISAFLFCSRSRTISAVGYASCNAHLLFKHMHIHTLSSLL